MYVHYSPYINVTYDTSHYLLRTASKSVANQIFFNDELSRTCLLRTDFFHAQRYEHAAFYNPVLR